MIKRKFVKADDLKNFKNISFGLHLELRKKDTIKEIENQIKKFISCFNKLPSHLDGHQHIHLTPANLPKVLTLAKKYNLPVRSRFPEDRNIIRKFGVNTPAQFISWHPKRKHKLWERMANIRTNTTELVCHPGYYDKNCKALYNAQREEELKILKSRQFPQKTKRFKKINYYGI